MTAPIHRLPPVGLRRIFRVLGSLGLNNPPAAAGGILVNITCVETLAGQFALLSPSSLCNLRTTGRVFAISQPFNNSSPLKGENYETTIHICAAWRLLLVVRRVRPRGQTRALSALSPGPDRLHLSGRHLDRGRKRAEYQASHRASRPRRLPAILARRPMDRLLVRPQRQSGRLRHPGGRRRG